MFDLKKVFSRKPKTRAVVLHWSNNEAIRSCLHALRGECTVADSAYQEAASGAVFLAGREGTWRTVASVHDLEDQWTSNKVYILWGDNALPSLRCTGGTALEHMAEIQKVAKDVFLVSENMDRILHFDGDMIRVYPE